jgi:transcriptional regulator with XRE-family HTH domain
LFNYFSIELRERPFYGKYCCMSINAAQTRAARGLLGWSQQDLAEKASVGIATVYQLESGKSAPRRATLTVIRQALEAAGVIFIDADSEGPGVRLRRH